MYLLAELIQYRYKQRINCLISSDVIWMFLHFLPLFLITIRSFQRFWYLYMPTLTLQRVDIIFKKKKESLLTQLSMYTHTVQQ